MNLEVGAGTFAVIDRPSEAPVAMSNTPVGSLDLLNRSRVSLDRWAESLERFPEVRNRSLNAAVTTPADSFGNPAGPSRSFDVVFRRRNRIEPNPNAIDDPCKVIGMRLAFRSADS
jgi:hypothetical protein